MFAPPTIEYSLILPLLIISATGVLGVLLEAFLPRKNRFTIQASLAALGVVAALISTISVGMNLTELEGEFPAKGEVLSVRSFTIDGPTIFLWVLVLVFALLSFGLFAERRLEGGLSAFTGRAADAPGSVGERRGAELKYEHSEVFPLAIFALLGMMLFAASNDLLVMFIALEVLSLPLYLMSGLARRRRLLSLEAALKYFLLGAFASAFFLFGTALAYGYSGSFDLAIIDKAVSSSIGQDPLLLAAVGLIMVGLMFKIGAVPFHTWTPDTYQGAPTPVTAFMAAGTKAAAIIALARVLFVGVGAASWDWMPIIWIISVVTMLVGSIIAIAQSDVKRMLAYSSIAHAGFLLVAIAGMNSIGGSRSLTALLFYLLVYGVATIGAFAIVSIVRDADGEATNLASWAGLGKTSPFVASIFTLFMLSFAGIPLTSGFIGKWTVFTAAWVGGAWFLVLLGVLASAIAAYFYVRIIVLMFFNEPSDKSATVAIPSILTTSVIAVTAIATIVLGLMPGPALEIAQNVGVFVR